MKSSGLCKEGTMSFNCLFQHQMRREGSVSKWYKHLSHRIVTPPSGLSTRASFKQHLMITERVFSPRNLQSLDATFRDTLKLSFGQTGRHCHFESCLGKQERVNQRYKGGNWPHSPGLSFNPRLSGTCPSPRWEKGGPSRSWHRPD